MITARCVGIGNNDNIGATEVGRQFVLPFVGAAWIAARNHADLGEGVDVLLAFDDENGAVLGDGLDQLGQAVWQFADVAHAPDGLAVAVVPTLREAFRINLTISYAKRPSASL